MKNHILLTLLCLCSLSSPLSAQETHHDSIMVAFWNLENFFDPFVDSTRTYNAFTENGAQHWTKSRFYHKRNNIYKAILSFSKAKPIGILGVCEVENDYVLQALFVQTPLKRFNYRWVHYEGPDRRGIDPAIVYSKDLFQLIASEAIAYRNPKDSLMISRDILYAKFHDYRNDTLHCFVNHWPSKYRGELETVEARNCAARIVRHKVDSIINIIPEAKILIMGDFNDTPDASCIQEILGAGESLNENAVLINLFTDAGKLGFAGTLKHQESWMTFDQIIVSKSMINSESLHCSLRDAEIIHDDFLLADDKTYYGVKLNRTYLGPKYLGGFSDHLPVRLLLRY